MSASWFSEWVNNWVDRWVGAVEAAIAAGENSALPSPAIDGSVIFPWPPELIAMVKKDAIAKWSVSSDLPPEQPAPGSPEEEALIALVKDYIEGRLAEIAADFTRRQEGISEAVADVPFEHKPHEFDKDEARKMVDVLGAIPDPARTPAPARVVVVDDFDDDELIEMLLTGAL